jgi:hypothetical protein
MLVETGKLGHKITGSMGNIQLVFQNPVPGGTTGTGRTRQAKYQGTVGQTGDGPGLYRGGADFTVGKITE